MNAKELERSQELENKSEKELKRDETKKKTHTQRITCVYNLVVQCKFSALILCFWMGIDIVK